MQALAYVPTRPLTGTCLKAHCEPISFTKLAIVKAAGAMAQNLPFSVDNILRSDFPHPSRITKAPRVLYVAPSISANKVPFVALRCQLDRRMNHCNETEFFGRGSFSPQTLPASPEKDVCQNSGHIREQQRKRGMLNIIFNICLLVKFLF